MVDFSKKVTIFHNFRNVSVNSSLKFVLLALIRFWYTFEMNKSHLWPMVFHKIVDLDRKNVNFKYFITEMRSHTSVFVLFSLIFSRNYSFRVINTCIIDLWVKKMFYNRILIEQRKGFDRKSSIFIIFWIEMRSQAWVLCLLFHYSVRNFSFWLISKYIIDIRVKRVYYGRICISFFKSLNRKSSIFIIFWLKCVVKPQFFLSYFIILHQLSLSYL